MAAQLPAPFGEQIIPDDDLHVARLVLDGDENSAATPLGVLPGHGPTGDFDPFAVLQPLHLGGGEHVCIQPWSDELHEVPPGVDAHYPVLADHLLVGGEVGQSGDAVFHGDGKGGLAVSRGPDIEASLPQGLPSIGRDTVEGPCHDEGQHGLGLQRRPTHQVARGGVGTVPLPLFPL